MSTMYSSANGFCDGTLAGALAADGAIATVA